MPFVLRRIGHRSSGEASLGLQFLWMYCPTCSWLMVVQDFRLPKDLSDMRDISQCHGVFGCVRVESTSINIAAIWQRFLVVDWR